MSAQGVQKTVTTMNNNSPELLKREKELVAKLTSTNVDDVRLDDTGWTSRVYIVGDGHYVFKFPRMEEVKKEYIQEIKAYRMLEPIASHIQVPIVQWTHRDNDYFGYEGIVGDPLTAKLTSLSNSEKTTIGQSIGEFLKTIAYTDT